MEHGAFARLRKELLELAEDPPAGCWCDDTASYVSHPFLQPGTHEEPTTHSQRGGRASLVQVRLTTPREGPVARYWQALVAGPEGTPYEEGLFRLVLVFKAW
ncbi:unnamed protein product [Effrenium voratum]|uniref:Uncharacterized protein n=1 Tax=Effrenium voratum TaxID=2562239 RepID=A0AA36IYY9_9DINO|nr:unnamed protein product [Effrenium voratum]